MVAVPARGRSLRGDRTGVEEVASGLSLEETLTATGLIDTTEMYLRTIFELEEEGIVPLRARIGA
jgi:hypothetical protein